MTTDAGWEVERTHGPAGPQHQRALPTPVRRSAWIHHVDRPTVVLGSGQPEDVVDHDLAAAQGFDVVRRRSGGGAVLLEPGASAWIDLLVPTVDVLWDDDVVVAADWVGATFRSALADLGVAAEVHHGRLEAGRWGELVCFAGRGPGEISVDGRKVVGLSQRRTRQGARFQCLVVPRWEPTRLLSVLALSAAERTAAANDLAPSPTTGSPVPAPSIATIEAAVLARLPSSVAGTA